MHIGWIDLIGGGIALVCLGIFIGIVIALAMTQK